MENKPTILSKEKILLLYKNNKQNLCRVLKTSYLDTYNYINDNFNYVKPFNIHNNSGKNKFTEKIYRYVYGVKGVCKQCNVNPTTFRSFSEGYFDFCNDSCIQIFTANKYGVNNLFQSQKIKEKTKITCLNKYGTEHPMKSENVKLKGKLTKLNKYGNENYNNIKKNQQTMLYRYGVKSPSQMEGYFEKWTKSGIMKKSFVFPSGKKIKVQGYEDKALPIMLKKYTEQEILEQNPPKIKYIENGVGRIFYPDFFIKKDNLIIEIKSKFTYNRWISKNILKKESSEKQGYNLNFWILNRNGTLEEIL